MNLREQFEKSMTDRIKKACEEYPDDINTYKTQNKECIYQLKESMLIDLMQNTIPLESRPQHKEIVWKGSIAYCGDKPIGYFEYEGADIDEWYAYDIWGNDIYADKYLMSEQEAKQSVEQAFDEFYKSVTQ